MNNFLPFRFARRMAPTECGTERITAPFLGDAERIALSQCEGPSTSLAKVWTIEVDPPGTPGAAYAYQLRRTVAGGAPAERHFRVVFDLTRPVALPPPAWGW